MPCFGNSPIPGSTWQRPQIPRPPQTESMSTPSDARGIEDGRAPANRPRRPDGVKTTERVVGHRRTRPRSAAAA